MYLQPHHLRVAAISEDGVGALLPVCERALNGDLPPRELSGFARRSCCQRRHQSRQPEKCTATTPQRLQTRSRRSRGFRTADIRSSMCGSTSATPLAFLDARTWSAEQHGVAVELRASGVDGSSRSWRPCTHRHIGGSTSARSPRMSVSPSRPSSSSSPAIPPLSAQHRSSSRRTQH